MAPHRRSWRCDLRQTQQAATAFRRLIGGLAAEICIMTFQVFAWLTHEALRVLPDTQGLRRVFRALGIVPGYPTYAQFCADSILYLGFFL